MKIFSILLVLCLAVPMAFADEVEETIQEAIKAYKSGNLSDASGSLDYASQLIRQKKSEGFTKYLPKALDGWKADDAQSSSVGKAMFGGGVAANRRYKKSKSRVDVNIVADSPMMATLLTVFSNPMFATGNGNKLTRVSGQKAMYKFNKKRKRGEYQVIVGNKVLVTIKGQNVSEADLKSYAKAVKYTDIKKDI